MPDHGRDSNLTLTFVPIPRSVYDQLVSRHEHGTRRIKRFGRLPSSQCHNGERAHLSQATFLVDTLRATIPRCSRGFRLRCRRTQRDDLLGSMRHVAWAGTETAQQSLRRRRDRCPAKTAVDASAGEFRLRDLPSDLSVARSAHSMSEVTDSRPINVCQRPAHAWPYTMLSRRCSCQHDSCPAFAPDCRPADWFQSSSSCWSDCSVRREHRHYSRRLYAHDQQHDAARPAAQQHEPGLELSTCHVAKCH